MCFQAAYAIPACRKAIATRCSQATMWHVPTLAGEQMHHPGRPGASPCLSHRPVPGINLFWLRSEETTGNLPYVKASNCYTFCLSVQLPMDASSLEARFTTMLLANCQITSIALERRTRKNTFPWNMKTKHTSKDLKPNASIGVGGRGGVTWFELEAA